MSVTSQDEDGVPWGNTTPPESETPDQESSDQPETANIEPAGTDSPTETPNAAHVEPELEKRYPSRVRQ